MNNMIAFSPAGVREETEICNLLSASELPVEDVRLNFQHFISAKKNGRLIGCVGLERSGKIGLLRSLAVSDEFRRQGVAQELCNRVEQLAKSAGILNLYLLTTSASGFFTKRGYLRIERSEAPQAIQRNKQFTTLCPSSAVLMMKAL